MIAWLFLFSWISLCRGFYLPLAPDSDANKTKNIYSDSFPENYSNSLDVNQTAVVEEGHFVQLVFQHFETEKDADFVYLYDGEGEGATLIAKLSGVEQVRKVFTTTVSNKMTIRLKTDLDRNFSGFWAEYKAVKGNENEPVLSDCAQQTHFYQQDFGVITSPLWPDLYPDGANCIYIFKNIKEQIKFRFNFFQTEKDADILRVYSGEPTKANFIQKFSGDIAGGQEFIYDNTKNITLEFISDLDRRFAGFSITYYNF